MEFITREIKVLISGNSSSLGYLRLYLDDLLMPVVRLVVESRYTLVRVGILLNHESGIMLKSRDYAILLSSPLDGGCGN